VTVVGAGFRRIQGPARRESVDEFAILGQARSAVLRRTALAGGHQVSSSRGGHLAAIREHGLAIRSPLGDFVRARRRRTTRAVGPVEVVILAVKAYDNDTALRMLPPMTGRPPSS